MLELIQKAGVPSHIAVIMDGNGRWAQKQGAERLFGHNNAITSVRDTVEGCAELGVKFLTLYAFSTENWSRPAEEVQGLMQLLVATIHNEVPTLHKNNIKLNAIGDLASLPAGCMETLQEGMNITAGNTGLTLNLALSYSGKWDLTQATRRIAADVAEGKLNAAEVNEKIIADRLSTAGMPDPELLIRTSGEMRISNFMLWQLAYAELYVTEILWPEFRKKDLHEAILSYQKRERRFGLTAAQLKERAS